MRSALHSVRLFESPVSHLHLIAEGGDADEGAAEAEASSLAVDSVAFAAAGGIGVSLDRLDDGRGAAGVIAGDNADMAEVREKADDVAGERGVFAKLDLGRGEGE